MKRMLTLAMAVLCIALYPVSAQKSEAYLRRTTGKGEAHKKGKRTGISMDELEIIVSENDKGRYELSSDKTLVRALYGHSVEMNLDYVPSNPPDILFHGTAMKSYTSIIENGIVSRNRQFVHLSEDKETALSVGLRHGHPIVLEIDTRKKLQDGCVFYNPKKGIWLTDIVKPEYILSSS